MNWDAIAAIGQAISALALVVVIVQFRHARAETRRALSQGRAEAARDITALQTDERINRLQVKANAALGVRPIPFVSALMDQAGLTEEEARVMWLVQLSLWNFRIQAIPNINELSAIERTLVDGGFRSYGQPGLTRIFYETFIKATAHPDAVRYIDKVLAQPG